MKLHVLDGTYELFRAWFGAPPDAAPDGREVGATKGLIATTLALLRDPEVSHVAAAFDHVIESFRNDLYGGYKTGDGVPPGLMAQFPLAEEALAALGVRVWSMVEFEADDAMATAADRFGPEVEQVLLLSPDKDLTQCVVGSHVVTVDRRRQITLDAAGVREKFGVPPESIPDWLALVGDTADGIPGIPGWGAKTAAAVLSRYPHLEDIPADPARWEVAVRGAARLAENLAKARGEALLFRKLALLRTDVPIPDALDDLRWAGPTSAWDDLCDRLGLNDRTRAEPRRLLAGRSAG